MQRGSVLLRLADMQESLVGIGEMLQGVDFETYSSSWHLRRATDRGIEIISEASRHIPDEMKARHPDIPWREIAAIGNRLRHEYARVDDRILWEVTWRHLPALAAAVEAMTRLLDDPADRGRAPGGL